MHALMVCIRQHNLYPILRSSIMPTSPRDLSARLYPDYMYIEAGAKLIHPTASIDDGQSFVLA